MLEWIIDNLEHAILRKHEASTEEEKEYWNGVIDILNDAIDHISFEKNMGRYKS